jgi:hypothetical protein
VSRKQDQVVAGDGGGQRDLNDHLVPDAGRAVAVREIVRSWVSKPWNVDRGRLGHDDT